MTWLSLSESARTHTCLHSTYLPQAHIPQAWSSRDERSDWLEGKKKKERRKEKKKGLHLHQSESDASFLENRTSVVSRVMKLMRTFLVSRTLSILAPAPRQIK